MHLPVETLLKIFVYEDISIKDVVNFSSTCKQIRYTLDNNHTFWQKKIRIYQVNLIFANFWLFHFNSFILKETLQKSGQKSN